MRTIRIRLSCATEAEFERRVLPRLTTDGLFVPTPSLPMVHDRLNLKLELQSGLVLNAEVEAIRLATASGKPGFIARLLKLAPLQPPSPPPPPAPMAEEQTSVYRYSHSELRAAATDQWVGGLRPFDPFGRYQLLKRLGMSDTAESFLARSQLGEGIDKLVVLKVLRPEFGPSSQYASLFLNEARVSLTLQHPNLIQVFDFGEAMGLPFLAMEYVEGWTLESLLAAFATAARLPPPALAVRVAADLCQALEYVHAVRDLEGRSLNLVHRDLRAAKVLVSETGEIKLLDLEVVATSRAAGASGEAMQRKPICPEDARGEAPTTAWDIYAMGALLDQLLTLRLPPLQESASATPVRPLPSAVNPRVPLVLDRAVLSATELDPARRPRSVRELRAMVEQARSSVSSLDVGALCRTMLGAELVKNKAEVERLMATARQRKGGRSRGSRALLRPFQALRAQAGRRPKLSVAIAAALLGLTTAAGWAVGRTVRAERELVAVLSQVDEHLSAARLAGPGGSALDLLLSARQKHPGDLRVEQRLRMLADASLQLADVAERRGHPGESLVHLRTALQADPTRPGLADRIQILVAALPADATARSAP